MGSDAEALQSLEAGMPIPFGGNRLTRVSEELAAAFQDGDSLLVVQRTGQLLHVPSEEAAKASDAVGRAAAAFGHMSQVTDAAISSFFESFALKLEDDAVWGKVLEANSADVDAAKAKGRSTTRLVASEKLRAGMVDGLRGWISAPSRRGQLLETVAHPGFHVDLVGAELGVVGFVFEGRPNVLADATGVLRGGNTVVYRIGSDALGTARCIMEQAVQPALKSAGLPLGAVCLVDSASHAAGWSLMSDSRLALAVARGSGPAVDTLGALASQAGIPVSLHGQGGAWIMASSSADAASLTTIVQQSLDRKVCNTLNTLCLPTGDAASALIPAALAGLQAAAEARGQSFKLHVAESDRERVPVEMFEQKVQISRAEGIAEELQVVTHSDDRLGHEWEWEDSPEITLKFVDDFAHFAALFNHQSPLFVASLVSPDADEHALFYKLVRAPFVGDGHTRWVDGQKALSKPELGLSNWQYGRLMGRGGILSGDSVFTVRTRYCTDP